MPPQISAIIVLYKSEKFIGDCIKSILKSAKQVKLKIEIILVVNDKKNHQYIFPEKALVIKSNKNLGYAKGINIGAKIAKGEWLLIANPDTITDRNALYYLSKHFFNNKIGIIGPKIILPDNTLQLTINQIPSFSSIFLEQSYLYKIRPFIFFSPKANIDNYLSSHFVDALEGTYFLVRRKYFEKIYGMDEQFFLYFEDMDFCKRITNKNYKILFESKAKIIHYRSLSTDGVMMAEEYVKSFRKLFIKYYSKQYAINTLCFLLLGNISRQYYWSIKEKITNNVSSKLRALNMKKYYQDMKSECLKYLFA